MKYPRLRRGIFIVGFKRAFGKASLGLRTTGKAADMLDGETTGHAVEVSHYIRAVNTVGGAVMVGIFTDCDGRYAATAACVTLDRSVKPFSTKITAPACVICTQFSGHRYLN